MCRFGGCQQLKVVQTKVCVRSWGFPLLICNVGPDSSSAMQKFVQGASQRKEGATTPLWSRYVYIIQWFVLSHDCVQIGP